MYKYLILLTILVVGCGSPGGQDEGEGGEGGISGSGGTVNTGGSGGTVNTGGSGGAAGVGGTAGFGGSGGTVEPGCVPGGSECSDCIDNDADGLTDAEDPYCLGPFDNTESDENLGTGVGGEGAENCKADCYFDDGGGSGDDTCTWNHTCDDLAPMANCVIDKPSEELLCASWDHTQTDLCYDVCMPITPNGCDCFGCCEIPGVEGHVFLDTENGDLGGNCTLDTPEYCAACTPQDSCYNPLVVDPPNGVCELGIGQTVANLPEECQSTLRCPDQLDPLPCGEEGDSACPSNNYCLNGCCVEIIVQ